MIRDYLMAFLIGICLILMVFSWINNSMSKTRRNALFFMALTAVALNVSYELSSAFNGSETICGIFVSRLGRFLAYGLFLLIIYLFNQYLKDLFLNEEKVKDIPGLRYVEYILFSGFLMLDVSQIVGVYYTYDQNNLYQRGQFYFLSYVAPLVALLVQLAVIVKYRKMLRKRLVVLLLLFTAMPFATSGLQFFLHGVSFNSISIVAMVVLLYCFSIIDTNHLVELAHKKEIEILKEKEQYVKTMVSQTTEALVEAIDAKDAYTQGHSRRVAEYSKLIAEKAGKSKEECDEIFLIGLLHDVGKIGIPDAIINKKGKLTDEEFDIIKTHPSVGREILSKINIAPNLAVGASFHHERYDGKGYPFKLRGKEIPEIARIIAVADSYDAMASKRSYRDGLQKEVIRGELEKCKGTQFDPEFADIMIQLIDEGIK